ncbi:MAG: DegT/DnrJ/EryC1/StrS family aminotransferase [Actinobacteria bacterium]|nr:DegT/DnrJ/EryC1/StrS family aminotransferase [Actinomycetota bacterium]
MGSDGSSARPWLSPRASERETELLASLPVGVEELEERIAALIARNRSIHESECVNLNPATNVMNPVAEAALGAGLGSRPSLGHPGEKYEMGLEAIEQLEVIAAALACRVLVARFAELRVASGSMANLYAFMATCAPGDAIVVPPPSVGGHITHDRVGAAGLYGLEIHHAPIDAERYTVDVATLADLVDRVRPRLITIGGSLNLLPHPVAAIREVADGVGARVLFDAAHACGMIAGRVWPNPLDEGADLLTMSTYKSLGGPPAGLVLTNDEGLAARIDAIAHPGLTANFDVGNTAALAIGLLDWLEYGADYAAAMTSAASALAGSLGDLGVPVFSTVEGPTTSHQFALHADRWGGGQAMAEHLRHANLLTSAIGLPTGDGLRIGTPEIVRWGMKDPDMPELAGLVHDALGDAPEDVATRVTEFRQRFRDLHFIRN